MKRISRHCGFAFMCFLVADSGHIAQADTRVSHDGRFSTHCHAWVDDTNVEMCWPTIFRLLARPEEYDKKLITITGFLVRVHGDFLLFPSSDRVATGAHEDAIELLDGASIAESAIATARKAKRYRNGAPVVVTGIFDAWYGGRGIGRAGGIKDIRRIALPFVIEPDLVNGSSRNRVSDSGIQ